MSGLDLNRLEQYRDEILKAEISGIFAILKDKDSKWKNIINMDIDFNSFFKNKFLRIDGNNYEIDDFIKNWRNKWDTPLKKIFNVCEILTSQLEKSNISNKKITKISNPFGSLTENNNKTENNNNENSLYTKAYIELIFSKSNSNLISKQKKREELIENLSKFFKEIVADDRFPNNEVSLWDQAYMTTSMFKSLLVDKILGKGPKNIKDIKWRVLGIQYDKMGLVEKGFKLASIKWYRDRAKKTDETIKKLLEVVYPLGNEIYRDETGIYFIVGKYINKDSQILNELIEKINRIFKYAFCCEIFPTISLTKSSRGLMNLSILLENTRENFLKKNTDLIKFQKQELEKYFLKRKVSEIEELKEYPIDKNTEFILKKDKEKIPKKCGREEEVEYNFAIGVCPICQVRLIFRSDKCKNNSPTICEVCDSRIHHSQVASWIDNISGETIWIDEIKDKNNRITYISLKFELEDWLNGDLLNSLLEINDKNFKEKLSALKKVILNKKERLDIDWLHISFSHEKRLEKIGQINANNILFSIIKGTKWEDWIKQTPLNNKINWQEEKIKWEKFTNKNDPALDILATLLLQFLLRKNSSPARLRRIWETTREFLEIIHDDLDEILKIPEWRKKRLVWEVDYTDKIKETGEELEGSGLLFWAQPNEDKSKIKVYLISSIEDFIEKFGNENLLKELDKKDEEIDKDKIKSILENKNFKIELKPYFEDKNKGEGEILITLTKADTLDIHSYKPYSLITDISPVNYQIIIPAEHLPKFIDKVLEKYNEEFKYVYGKLPIHIGIVVSNYKKPLYVNLKALRKIRRDIKDTEKLWINENTGKFCQLQKEKLSYATTEEKVNNTEDYYSLHFDNKNEKDYNFYIKPNNNWKYWISTFGKFPTNSKVKIIPNTFDFEFMDANTRRNDIYYDENKNYKRALSLKSNRPYELEIYWSKFKAFRELFKDKTNVAKMHKLVSLFYEKLQDYDSKYNPLLASAIINILELKKNKDAKKYISQIFDLDENASNFQQELSDKLNEEKLKLFIDMFEFWHTALKEV